MAAKLAGRCQKGGAAIEKALVANFELTAGSQKLDITGIFANDEFATVVV